MLRVEIDEHLRAKLRAIGREPDTPWWIRERVEMALLAAAGWSAPRIAHHFACHPQTVRRFLKAFRANGLGALERGRPGPEPDLAYRSRVQHALEDLLGQARSWTAAQLSDALYAYGIDIGPRQVRRYLTEMGAHWRRTKNSLAHKQRQEEVRRAKAHLAALKKSPGWTLGAVLRG